MTGQTQNTSPTRIKSLFAAAVAVVMLGTGMSAGYAIASLDQSTEVSAPTEVKTLAPSRTRGQAEDAAAVAGADGLLRPVSDRHQAGTATKTITKDTCTGARAAQASSCYLAKVGV